MMKRIILFVIASLLAACTPGTVSTPTQASDYTIRVELASTTVWADLRIQNEQDVISAELVSVSGDPTYQEYSPGGQAIDQPSSEVDAGNEVSITVDYRIKVEASEHGLSFRLQRDNLNGCTVRLYHLVGEEARLVYELDHQDETGLDEKNTIDFTLDLNEMVVFLTEVPPEALQPADDSASIIFHNGVILTMEAEPLASAIAVKGEYILDVGSDEDMLAYAGPGTKLIDLEGRTLMPGFVDPHSHIFANWQGDTEGAQNDILSKGITTDAEMNAPENIMQGIVDLDRAGQLRLRVSLYPAHVDFCGNLLGSWYLEKFPATREPGAMLQIPGVKIFNDGGGCNVPATSYHYVGRDDYGDLYFSVEELTAIIVEAQNNGYQVAIHSLGDRAIQVSQQAIAAVLGGGPNIFHHRIEHNAILPDELLPIYSEYDIGALIFGYFPTCFFIGDNSNYAYRTPEEFSDWEWRWRALVDANPDAHIAWHADSLAMGPQDPFLHLQGFVTRTEVRDDGSLCEPPEWAADDLLSVEEALPMMTIEAAYALRRDEEIGSLKAGKLADMIIISDNPMEVDPETIRDIQVWMTMVGGNVEYCAQGHEAMCP
jgi:predicted amidohydrolase YtcJ